MFGRSVRLFTLLGFEVKIDFSWLIIAVLIVWSLAVGYFPQQYQNYSQVTYWWMGIVGALGLFISIILHELSHSLMARKYGIPMKGITLFIFGGVAEMSDEPPNAKSEFMMAIAGPVASILIGLLMYVFYFSFQNVIDFVPLFGVAEYLAFINLILATFNMVPAFPLDGGRVLRAAIWWKKANLRKATRITSQIGSGFGIFLIVVGVLTFIGGNFIGGVWWFMIGMFLRHASRMSYQQLLMRKTLEGEKVERFMQSNPISVPPDLTLDKFIENYIYKYHFKMFPVVEKDNNGKLFGCVNIKQVKDVPRSEWSRRTVGELVNHCTADNTISVDSDATKALSIMHRTGNSRLMVTDNSHLVGVISLKDLMQFLSLKVDLEDVD